MTDESRAVVVQNGNQALDFGVQAVVSIDQALRRIKELQHFMAAVMVKGEDYGVIPGTGSKPSLLKPGAEKLCEMYGLAPTFEITESERDFEAPFFHYEMVCRLVSKNTGVIMAEGLGSCNSREKRYRNQDTYSIANTILKMAKKRALVDAALSATRSSGIFTQDIEDFAEDAAKVVTQPAPRQQPATRAAPAQQPPPAVSRKALENRYDFLANNAAFLDLDPPAKPRDPSWPDGTLMEEGVALASRVTAAENAAQQKASV